MVIVTLFIMQLYSTVLHAQLCIDGRVATFDTLTHTMLATIPKTYFGQDMQLFVSATGQWTLLSIEVPQTNTNTYLFENIDASSHYPFTALTSGGQIVNGQILFTHLPIIRLEGNFGYGYNSGSFLLSDPDKPATDTLSARIKWRGGTTNAADKHKRNYKVKFDKDHTFFGLRNDNNWILDAGQADLFRLRNRIATELWNDFATKPYYSQQEPQARSGVRGQVVELFLNNEYRGIYSFTECMDRKQMKLCKADTTSNDIHGLLWKSVAYGYSTMWDNPVEPYDNTSDVWNAFETKYPELDDVDTLDWAPLKNAIEIVANAKSHNHLQDIRQYFDIPVIRDYHLFVELLNAVDNCGKNTYFAIYDKKKSHIITLAVWDLDITTGSIMLNLYNPKYVTPLHNIISYNKLDYLLLCDSEYSESLANRYAELRNSYFSVESLCQRYTHYYNLLSNSGAAAREEQRWSGDNDVNGYEINFSEEIEYICDWLKQRINFLDHKYSYTNNIRNALTKPSEKRIYNLQGQQINRNSQLKPGIYIQNGRKVVARR